MGSGLPSENRTFEQRGYARRRQTRCDPPLRAGAAKQPSLFLVLDCLVRDGGFERVFRRFIDCRPASSSE
jgi:hypothetical protein